MAQSVLSGATTPSQSGPGSDCYEKVLHIPQSSCITGTSPSDCLVLYSGDSLGESYSSAVKQSVSRLQPTGPPDRVLSMCQIEQNYVLMLN